MEIIDQQFTQSIETIAALEGVPVALEVYWDGDTVNDWFLTMSVIMKDGAEEMAAFRLPLAFEYGMELFPDEEWAVAMGRAAQALGDRLTTHYGIELYFPSPNETDDHCPSYLERHTGVPCSSCGKLSLPKAFGNAPADLCASCASRWIDEKNEQKRALQAQQEAVQAHARLTRELTEELPYTSRLGLEVYQGATLLKKPDPRDLLYKRIDQETYRKSDAIPPRYVGQQDWVRALMDEANKGIGNWDIWLAGEQVERLARDLEQLLDEEFDNFFHLEEQVVWFLSDKDQIKEVVHKGQTYHLTYLPIPGQHKKILALLDALERVRNAVEKGYSYRLSQTRGISYRQRHFLLFANYTRSNRTVASFQQKFGDVLDQSTILETLKGLEQLGFLALEGEEVIFLEKAKELRL